MDSLFLLGLSFLLSQLRIISAAGDFHKILSEVAFNPVLERTSIVKHMAAECSLLCSRNKLCNAFNVITYSSLAWTSLGRCELARFNASTTVVNVTVNPTDPVYFGAKESWVWVTRNQNTNEIINTDVYMQPEGGAAYSLLLRNDSVLTTAADMCKEIGASVGSVRSKQLAAFFFNNLIQGRAYRIFAGFLQVGNTGPYVDVEGNKIPANVPAVLDGDISENYLAALFSKVTPNDVSFADISGSIERMPWICKFNIIP